jgi:hypothetical protein
MFIPAPSSRLLACQLNSSIPVLVAPRLHAQLLIDECAQRVIGLVKRIAHRPSHRIRHHPRQRPAQALAVAAARGFVTREHQGAGAATGQVGQAAAQEVSGGAPIGEGGGFELHAVGVNLRPQGLARAITHPRAHGGGGHAAPVKLVLHPGGDTNALGGALPTAPRARAPGRPLVGRPGILGRPAPMARPWWGAYLVWGEWCKRNWPLAGGFIA